MKKKLEKIPRVLEERLLIDGVDRKLLKTIEDLSPYDSGNLYVAGNPLDRAVPTAGMIAEKVKMSEKEVLEKLEDIREKWNLPKNLPSNNNMLSGNDALIYTLLNQHKLRWDPKINDYRLKKIHVYTAEVGTGTLFTNNAAFVGEKIFRQAMDYNKMLNSYHIQGGVMPEIIAMFGKLKNQRALQTGLNQAEGEDNNEDELKKIKQILNLGEHRLTNRHLLNLKKYVINTIDSMEEAARSVAYELAPLLEDIPEHVPIHLYYSYNDDANLSEMEDLLISSMRKIQSRMEAASKNLPILREEYEKIGEDLVQSLVNKAIVDNVFDYLSTVREDIEDSKKEFPVSGKSFKEIVSGFFESEGKRTKNTDDLKKVLMEQSYSISGRKDKELFNTLFEETIEKYSTNFTTLNKIEEFKEGQDKKWDKLIQKKNSLENIIAENEQFENALITQQMGGHSWFTKKIAIKPTEAKALEMIKKDKYKRLYIDILIPEILKITGKKLDIKLHTDRLITVYVPDPALLLGMNYSFPDNLLYGTLISSNPRVNRQKSNEPLADSFASLQKFQENAVAERMQLEKKRPEFVKDFDKGEFGFSDVYLTSWGVDSYRSQIKLAVSPPRLEDEYRADVETTVFIKIPSRHDTVKLSQLLRRGNTGTWHGKRLDKGGITTGNVVHIMHADQSEELYFIDDNFYMDLAKKFGPVIFDFEEKIHDLENKLTRAKSPKSIEKYKKNLEKTKQELESVYEKIRPDIKYMLLANDLHIGSYSYPGSPSNVEGIRASQLAALQSVGLDDIVFAVMTEALHGELGFRGYDSKREGLMDDPVTWRRKIQVLNKELIKNGASYEDLCKYMYALSSEEMDSRSVFLPEDQKKMFREIEQPLLEELMDNGAVVYVGSGNHWNPSSNEDEASVLVNLFDKKYSERGLLKSMRSSGQNYSMDHVRLPSNKDADIKALISHKMKHGSTEISKIIDQATGTKENALYVLTADRHQPGAVAERGRFGVLDVGKQTVVPYVQQIGKASSIRGSMLVGYGLNRELLFSTRYFADPVIDKVIGWNEKASVLKTCHDIINESFKQESLVSDGRYKK